MYTFNHIEHHSSIVDDNTFFTQYLSEPYPWRYDSNFFLLKYQPALQEFKLIEEMQYVSHKELGLNHLKFYWPLDTPLTDKVTRYLDKHDYGLELLELYYLTPNTYTGKASQLSINIESVTTESIGAFKSFNFPKDKEVSTEFAHHKLSFYDDLLSQNSTQLLIAQLDGKIVASLITFERDQTIEIDDVIVHKSVRYRGVASHLLKVIADYGAEVNKDLILVADGEDTVGQMYKKLGFKLSGSLIAASKVFE